MAAALMGVWEIQTRKDERVTEWMDRDPRKASQILGMLGWKLSRQELGNLIPLLERGLQRSDAELRATAVGLLVRIRGRSARWSEIEPYLDHPDYAVRWHTLHALEHLEDALDLSFVIPAVLRFFERTEEDLEGQKNINVNATLREKAAEVLVNHAINSGNFSPKSKVLLVNGTDIKLFPEVRKVIKELKKTAAEAE
jgi:hypothetical protein